MSQQNFIIRDELRIERDPRLYRRRRRVQYSTRRTFKSWRVYFVLIFLSIGISWGVDTLLTKSEKAVKEIQSSAQELQRMKSLYQDLSSEQKKAVMERIGSMSGGISP